VRCESMGFGEGMNFFLTLQTLDLFTGPNCFQFVLSFLSRSWIRLVSAFTALSLYHVPVPCFKRDKTRDLAVLLPESPVAL